MMHKVVQGIKAEIKVKDIVIWFMLSFAGVLLVCLCIMKRSFEGSLLLEVLGFAVVFVLMMIGTKFYYRFVEGYYQSLIRHENKKNKKEGRKRP